MPDEPESLFTQSMCMDIHTHTHTHESALTDILLAYVCTDVPESHLTQSYIGVSAISKFGFEAIKCAISLRRLPAVPPMPNCRGRKACVSAMCM